MYDRIVPAGLAVVGLLLLPGCITSVAKVGTVVEEDRTLYYHADDFEIKSRIRNQFLDENMIMDINTDVYEGRVLLTGTVAKADEKRKAGEIAQKTPGAREVLNDVQVTDEGGVTATAEDVAIVTKLHYKLLRAKGVKSVNFRLRAVNGVVYLLGIAQSQTELDKILGIVRETAGVRQVVSHIHIKPA